MTSEMDKAVELWKKAGERHPDGKAVMSNQDRKNLYRDADRIAGGNRKLMAELTRRGLISWAF